MKFCENHLLCSFQEKPENCVGLDDRRIFLEAENTETLWQMQENCYRFFPGFWKQRIFSSHPEYYTNKQGADATCSSINKVLESEELPLATEQLSQVKYLRKNWRKPKNWLKKKKHAIEQFAVITTVITDWSWNNSFTFSQN